MMYNVNVKGQVAFFTLGFGVLGVLLVLFGSLVEVPYTTLETFNNYPYNPPGIWADAILTLQPRTYRYYALDLLNENNSLIYVKIEEATNPLVFMINGSLGYGFENGRTMVRLRISSFGPPESPFEYFWTPPTLGSWDFIFDNPYDTETNVTVKIIDYRYNAEWQEEVTRYHPPLDRAFAYAGIALIAASITPTAYQLYKTRKEMTKK
jgi:hypothetical protein